MPAQRFLFSEVFEVVPSQHDAFDSALADLHASLRTRSTCIALDKTVRVDACTSLINVIVWHHWRSKQAYKAARKSQAYVSFLNHTRRFCASRRSVVSHPVVAELAYHVRSGKPCANLSPSADANAREIVAAEEAVSRWERRRFRGEIPWQEAEDDDAHSFGSEEGSSSGASPGSNSGAEEDDGVTSTTSATSLDAAPPPTAPQPSSGGKVAGKIGVREELAATLLTKGWLAELAEMETKWRRMKADQAGTAKKEGWERMDDQWLLDMILV